MKKIYIVRHAKSSWSDMGLSDFDRPLNKRGKRDAPVMGGKCRELGYKPDIMISSSANRAATTAKIFRKALGVDKERLHFTEALYHAPEDTYIEQCYGLDEDIESVMLFGHNPGITYLANSVTSRYIDNVPTCGVLIIESSTDDWTALDFSNCKLMNYIYPKMY